jgi:hypothetical protein
MSVGRVLFGRGVKNDALPESESTDASDQNLNRWSDFTAEGSKVKRRSAFVLRASARPFACRKLAVQAGHLRSLPSRSSPQASEGWLAALDDFRNWLIREAA